MEPFTSNQAIGLLYAYHMEAEVYQLQLSKAEINHLNLCLIDEWNELTSHYKKQLVTQDKLEILSLMSKQQPIFKGQAELSQTTGEQSHI